MHMKLNFKKVVATVAASLVALSGVALSANSAAQAAVGSAANIRLVTPVINANNSVDHQADMNGWISNTWYAAGSTFRKVYAPVGASINMTYQATDADGNALSGVTIKLHVNKGWSGSNAALTSGSTTIGGSVGGNDGALLQATTDGFGDATFNLVNTDTTSGQTDPATLTEEPSGTGLYSQIYPEVNGGEAGDMIEFHFVNNMPNAASAPATDAYLAAVGPNLNDTNSVNQQGLADYFVSQTWYASGLKFRQAYAKVGTAVNAAWQYTDVDGKPIANQEVQLVVNKAYSSSTASLTSGLTSIAPTNGGADSAVLTATTDSFGVAIFPLQNTDSTSNETDPASLTTAPSGTQLYSQTFGQVAGKTSHSALIEYHFVTNVPTLGGSTPTPTPTPSGNGPAFANIRLLDSEKDTTTNAFLTPGWYNPDGDASPAWIKYGTVGETTTLTYVATDANGAPIANAPIKLLVNTAGQHAAYTKANGDPLEAAPTQATWWNGYPNEVWGGAVSGTTDANGQVTFTLKNTNTDAQGENIRADKTVWSDPTNGNTLEAGFYPTMQATTEHIDRIWYHLQASQVIADTSVNIRLIASQKDTAVDTYLTPGWYNPDGIYSPAYLKYYTAGGTITLTYVATDHNGAAIANTPIWLNINEDGTNATFTKADGSALDAAKAGFKYVGYGSAQFAGSLSGTTDANGQVTFTLKNADPNSAAENIRAIKNDWSAPTGAELKGAFYPTLAGANLEHIDRVWAHIVKMGAPVVTAGAASQNATFNAGKTVSFTVKNAIGAVVPNATVHFTTDSDGTLSSATGTTNASGVVTVTASATKAGTQTVTASYVDGDLQAGVTTANVVWSAPAASTAVSVSKRNIVVAVTNGKGLKQTVTITGQKAAAKTLTSWAKTSTAFKVTKAGSYTVTVKLGTKVVFSKKYTIK